MWSATVAAVSARASETDCEAWSLPNRSAVCWAASRSSKDASSKPMEKVCNRSDDWPTIAWATALESSPPERNAPSGTSLTICPRTARPRRSASSSTAWSAVMWRSTWVGRQYRRTRTPFASASNSWAGGSCFMPAKGLSGAGM